MLNQQEQKVNIENIEPNKLKDIMVSVEYFWLMTALATACAEEELVDYITPVGLDGQEIAKVFNQTVRNGTMTEEQLAQIRQAAWDKICAIAQFTNARPIFDKKTGVALSKSFISYWLIFQLIQLEWQEKLNMEEMSDTYNFLDGLIADGAELENIEHKVLNNELLDDDQEVYLRSNWERVRGFWKNLYEEIFLRLFNDEETRGMIC